MVELNGDYKGLLLRKIREYEKRDTLDDRLKHGIATRLVRDGSFEPDQVGQQLVNMGYDRAAVGEAMAVIINYNLDGGKSNRQSSVQPSNVQLSGTSPDMKSVERLLSKGKVQLGFDTGNGDRTLTMAMNDVRKAGIDIYRLLNRDSSQGITGGGGGEGGDDFVLRMEPARAEQLIQRATKGHSR